MIEKALEKGSFVNASGLKKTKKLFEEAVKIIEVCRKPRK